MGRHRRHCSARPEHSRRRRGTGEGGGRYRLSGRRRVADGKVHHRRRAHPARLRPRRQDHQRRRRHHGRRQDLPAGGHLLRRRIDARARRAACGAPDQSGRRRVHARPLQFRAHQGDCAGHRAVRRAHGRGQRRLAPALQQGLSLPVRGVVNHRAVPRERRCARGRACRARGTRPGDAEARRRLRERPVQPGHPRGRARRRGGARHPGRDRRPAAARAQRHGGDACQDEGAEADILVVSGHSKGAALAVRQVEECGSTCRCWRSRIATAPT